MCPSLENVFDRFPFLQEMDTVSIINLKVSVLGINCGFDYAT